MSKIKWAAVAAALSIATIVPALPAQALIVNDAVDYENCTFGVERINRLDGGYVRVRGWNQCYSEGLYPPHVVIYPIGPAGSLRGDQADREMDLKDRWALTTRVENTRNLTIVVEYHLGGMRERHYATPWK